MPETFNLKKENNNVDLSPLKNVATDKLDEFGEQPEEDNYEDMMPDPEQVQHASTEKFDNDTRKVMVSKCKRYLMAFQEELQHFRSIHFDSLSDDDLELTLDNIRTSLSGTNYSSVVNGMWNSGITIYEGMICQYTEIKAQGVSTLLNPNNNAELNMILKECEIEYLPSMAYTPPYMRLLFCVGGATAQAHVINSQKQNKNIEKEITKNIDEDMTEDYFSKYDNL